MLEFLAKLLPATASEGLAQAPYVAAGVVFESATPERKAPNLPLNHHAQQLLHVPVVMQVEATAFVLFVLLSIV